MTNPDHCTVSDCTVPAQSVCVPLLDHNTMLDRLLYDTDRYCSTGYPTSPDPASQITPSRMATRAFHASASPPSLFNQTAPIFCSRRTFLLGSVGTIPCSSSSRIHTHQRAPKARIQTAAMPSKPLIDAHVHVWASVEDARSGKYPYHVSLMPCICFAPAVTVGSVSVIGNQQLSCRQATCQTAILLTDSLSRSENDPGTPPLTVRASPHT